MKQQLISLVKTSVSFLLLFTLVLGLGYPYLMNLIGATFFPREAHGSLIKNKEGRLIGSSLIGQGFTDEKYFHPRLSFAGPLGYDGASSGASYLAPSSEKFVDIVSNTCLEFRAVNHIDSQIPIPSDAATSSASGLDPHITLINARMQAPRIAQARNLPLDEVLMLLSKHTESSFFTIEPYINVLHVNLALDAIRNPTSTKTK